MHEITHDIALGEQVYTLTPPRGWALDLIASNGIDYLNPNYVDRVLVLDEDDEPVMGEDGEYVTEDRFTPVPPNMTRLRMTGIVLAALLTQAEGLDDNKVPVHIWTPEEVLEVLPIEAADAFAMICMELVLDALPKPEKKADTQNPPKRRCPRKRNRGGAKRSGQR
jgi:hypothetical protein